MRRKIQIGLLVALMGFGIGVMARADDAPKGAINWDRARELFEKAQRGEKLTSDEQAYLDQAKASAQNGRGGGQAPTGVVNGIDWEKARALHQKEEAGEKLTPDEQAYLEKAKQAMRNGAGPNQNPGAPPPNTGTETKASNGGIDWDRARKLHQMETKGEKLSADDQAYLDKAKEALRNGARPDGQPGQPRQGSQRNQSPPTTGKESVDITPLTDMKSGDKYKDQDGGLYGGGSNTPPAAQLKLALAAAASVRPLDSAGKPADDGKIVLMTIGMSNTTMESQSFKALADADSSKNPKLIIVDGAQGGKDAASWVRSDADWKVANQRIESAGASPNQVQAVWIKQALMGPARHGEFPKHAEDLRDDFEQIVLKAKQHYPNLKLAYLSSRIYAGYAGTQLNPEPYAFEGAFSVRWVIQEQLKPNGMLNADASRGAVTAPVVLWGPYLWADGTKGRKTDSLVYERKDLSGDGTHPSQSGQRKVGELLLNFFKTDETAKSWFVK